MGSKNTSCLLSTLPKRPFTTTYSNGTPPLPSSLLVQPSPRDQGHLHVSGKLYFLPTCKGFSGFGRLGATLKFAFQLATLMCLGGLLKWLLRGASSPIHHAAHSAFCGASLRRQTVGDRFLGCVFYPPAAAAGSTTLVAEISRPARHVEAQKTPSRCDASR